MKTLTTQKSLDLSPSMQASTGETFISKGSQHKHPYKKQSEDFVHIDTEKLQKI
jgi:hypothetical protein